MIKKILIVIVALITILIWLIWDSNNVINITHIEYSNSKIPSEFKGYKIVQLSDLHNKRFGKNQNKLASKIKSCEPDIIVITGDLTKNSRYDTSYFADNVMELINQVVEIAPTYYVAGNHEAYTREYQQIKQRLQEIGVTVLDNESILLTKNEQSINLIGILDPRFYSRDGRVSRVKNELKELSNEECFQVLLSHRPELMDIYVENNIDLVFTGHSHGGQFRIPFIGGIYSPNQGWFPTYIDGRYEKDNTTMIVNKGLGSSVIPIRILNRPEIILLELAD